ncbi:hypothetical protein [Afipia broomeae]|uniref:Uncharacterized protein n=1 Tax=Afipia broomeae ATCC 49717 TaxID=883078 RepID=K8PRL4_9BRAD|nr:hypothetical protein [Afipia broomeae]EKS42160.1 hypothetical protein HMPREF9695_01252 [Afipia broomeae ATCC 49717]
MKRDQRMRLPVSSRKRWRFVTSRQNLRTMILYPYQNAVALGDHLVALCTASFLHRAAPYLATTTVRLPDSVTPSGAVHPGGADRCAAVHRNFADFKLDLDRDALVAADLGNRDVQVLPSMGRCMTISVQPAFGRKMLSSLILVCVASDNGSNACAVAAFSLKLLLVQIKIARRPGTTRPSAGPIIPALQLGGL